MFTPLFLKNSLIDSSGNEVVQYVYDAWGNHTVSGSNTTLGNLNPFRYRSYFYDTETQLYYLKTRYYDPYTGRFINMDGIQYADPETINGLNLYAYCGNNPVNYVDPDGNAKWWQWALLGLGLVVVVGAGVAATIASGGAALLAGTAAIAGSIGGLGSIAYQGITNGWDNIDIGAVGASMLLCSAGGALSYAGGSALLGASNGVLALASGGTVSIGAAAATAGIIGIIEVLLATTGKSGGYWGHKYSDDHKPDHIHLKGTDGTDIKIGRNGKPLPGQPPLKPQQRKALERLWEQFLALFG